MKILHTADWHIGKKLHRHDLYADFELFINWLCAEIAERKVDLLLVSGDIFDLANPSSEARSQYYRALMALHKLDCNVIMTGGNHDSPDMLNAPRELLQTLNLHVVGGLPQNLEDTIIPIKNSDDSTQLVVAALPYLRDADLRASTQGHTYDDKIEAVREGIAAVFEKAVALCKQHYPNIPAIALGHLYAAGVEPSESERDIQIGNQAAFSASQLGDYFKYIALGHIHSPQRVTATVPTYYSGSPLPLSFSERDDAKRVLLIDTAQSWIPESIAVPSFRKLIKIGGTIDVLRTKLHALQPADGLDSLIELELREENYDAVRIYELDQLVSAFQTPGYEIVKHRATFTKNPQGSSTFYEDSTQLEDLQPRDVFKEMLADHEYDGEVTSELLSAFDELLEATER